MIELCFILGIMVICAVAVCVALLIDNRRLVKEVAWLESQKAMLIEINSLINEKYGLENNWPITGDTKRLN